ncbi:WD repeat-containing protein 49-like [Anguilla anguilla]|uniref:WD repeat-containing protein 49-like n=1 Tax=Anguilla anguilla TaxID=7936 RepID=UPI0015ABF236|nr:WD repeat-containing protein 49-like [Anguilla anguilla]
METKKEAELLECRLSVSDFVKMQNLFLPGEAGESGDPVSLERAEFVERACSLVGRGSREEYGQLFDNVDVTREGRVDWEKLTTFLLLELSEKDEHARAAMVTRWRPLRALAAAHREPVQQVAYLRSSDEYLSVSKDGVLAVWADDLALLKTHRLANDSVKPKDLWVTGMVVLANVQKIAVSFTSKEICFYDLLSKQEFSCQYKLQGLKHTPISLDYWFNPENSNEAVLSFGDVGGKVSGICFRTAQMSLFERPGAGAEQEAVLVIKWAELAQGRHKCCYTVQHQAHGQVWVRRVRFLEHLEAFMSCSTCSESSLVLAWREKEAKSLRTTPFHIPKGTNDQDYHTGLNLIATAGIDSRVCLWNPYVTSKPVGVLRGHMTSVVAVQFVLGKNQLMSFSKDKVLRVWDVHHQLCVQRVAGVFPRTQECQTRLFFHEECGRLLLTFNSLLTLLEAWQEVGRRVSSHEHAVTCVLYNPLFKQVISSDAGSTITCWLIDTGQKVKQFNHCHGDAEISTMALDASQTRLFTGGSDGSVKVWDFNGHCHHKLNAGRGQAVEISQILVLKRTVLVLGWERIITVFRLNTFSQFLIQPSEWKGGVQHRDDVLCAAFLPPQTLVTGSYDGQITVWNNSTENALRKLHWAGQQGLRSRSDSKLLRPHTVLATPRSSLPALPLLCPAPAGVEDPECSNAVTRLFFLEARKSVAAAGGADLVSCGGSGMVRFWNTAQGCIMGEFVAHEDCGSIIMTVDRSARYLITADMDGGVKVWDIQDYCLRPCEGVNREAPALLTSARPHLDCVTHLETCVHGGQLYLLSASADCSLALSYLPGAALGIFGQEVHWNLDWTGEPLPNGNVLQENQESESGRREGPGSATPSEQPSRGRGYPISEDASVFLAVEVDPDCVEGSINTSPWSSSILGKSYQERWSLRKSDNKPSLWNDTQSPIGTFSSLHMEELDAVADVHKPDFVTNPQQYFRESWDCATPIPSYLPIAMETVKAAFDAKSLFPRELLERDQWTGPPHGAYEAGTKRSGGHGRGRKPKATAAFKAK